MNELPTGSIPRISSIPGPRGPKGDKGEPGTNGSNGVSPQTTTTASFVMPAAGANVVVTVSTTVWMVVGLPIYIESAGSFTVVTILSGTSVTLKAQTATANAAAGTVIPAGKKVVIGAQMVADTAQVDALGLRVTALEDGTGSGNRSWYSTSAPSNSTGQLRDGDIWFDTDDGNRIYRWNGTGWVDVQRVLSLPDFGVGIRPIVHVSSLPTSGYNNGDFVWLTTDGKLYRRVNGAWTKAIATNDLVGQIDGAMIVNGTIIADKIGANAITSDKIGANEVITKAANIGDAVIRDVHVSNLAAGKITAGNIQSVNIGYSGKIFHPEGYTVSGVAATATATVQNGQVTGINVTAGGYGYDSPPRVTLVGGGGQDAEAVAVISGDAVSRIVITNPGVNYTSAPTVQIAQQINYRYFGSVEFDTSTTPSHTFAAATAWSFNHITPVIGVCPGNPLWGTTGRSLTLCPRANGAALVQIQGRLFGYPGLNSQGEPQSGPATIYCRVNSGPYVALASLTMRYREDTVIDTTRIIRGNGNAPFSITDEVKFYVAPCDGNGNIATAITCRADIDVISFNW